MGSEWRERLDMFRYAHTWPRRLEEAMRRRSRAYSLLAAAAGDRALVASVLEFLGPWDGPRDSSEAVRASPFMLLREEWPAALVRATRQMQADIAEMKSECESRDICFAGFSVPFYLSVTTPAVLRAMEKEQFEPELVWGKDDAMLQKSFRKAGVTSLSLRPVLRAMESPDEAYFREDGHLRPVGAATTAEALYEFIHELECPAFAQWLAQRKLRRH